MNMQTPLLSRSPSVITYVVESLKTHGALSSQQLAATRPTYMSLSAISSCLSELYSCGALSRIYLEKPDRTSIREMFIYDIADLEKVPPHNPVSMTARGNKIIRGAKPKQPQLSALVATPTDTDATRVIPYGRPIRSSEDERAGIADQLIEVTPAPVPTEVMIRIPVGDKGITLTLARARAVYDQLKVVFGP